MMENWEDIRRGIFAGESGGDYNALFGYQNRPGGKYENVKLTDMTLNDVAKFSEPSGEYGQWVKSKVGRVATPMGAYQVVGSTLRGAMKDLGLSGDEKFDESMQERLGQHIYKKQGTGAWEGYKGPLSEAQYSASTPKMSYPASVQPADDPMSPARATDPADSPLRKFAYSMGQSSDLISQAMERVNSDHVEIRNLAGSLVKGEPLPSADPNARSTPLGNPTGANPMLPNGMPMLPMSMGSPTGSVPAPVMSSNSAGPGGGGGVAPDAAAEAPVAGGFLAKLFPKIEDEGARRMAGADMLAALSQGLGQMSHGQPVDLSSVFNRMQIRQANAAQQLADASAAEQDAYFKQANLDISERNTQLGENRLRLDAAKQYADADGYNFSPEQLAAMSADPAYAGFVEGMSSPDKDVREAAHKAYLDTQKVAAAELIKNGGGSVPSQEALAGAYEVFSDPNAGPEEKAAALKNLDQDQIDRLVKLPGVALTAGVENANAYMNGTPEYRDAVDRIAKLNAGTQTDENYDRQFRSEQGQALYKELAKNVQNASRIDQPLRQVLAGQEALLASGASDDDMTRMFDSVVGSSLRAISGALGRSVTADEFMMEQFNIDSDALARLDGAEKTLLFTIGQQMLAKQGSVSDGERQMAANAILTANGNPYAKMEAIAHLQVANTMDRVAFDYFKDNAAPGFQNSIELESDINDMFDALRVPLGDALASQYSLDNAAYMKSGSPDQELLKRAAAEEGLPEGEPRPATLEYLTRVSPLMTDDQARRVGKYLPPSVRYYAKEDEDGVLTFIEIPR